MPNIYLIMTRSRHQHFLPERPHHATVNDRMLLRRQIRGEGVSMQNKQPQTSLIEITGLELLNENSSNLIESDDDSSCESYANDSFELVAPQLRSTPRVYEIQPRRTSDLSSLGQHDFARTHRSNETVDFNKYKSTRQSSTGSYCGDSIDQYYKTSEIRETFNHQSQEDSADEAGRIDSIRRTVVDINSNESYNGRSNSMRRSSIESYANDSIELGKPLNSTINRTSAGFYHSNNREDSRVPSSFRSSHSSSNSGDVKRSFHTSHLQMKERRMSASSAFSHDIYESQSISGGAGRAA